MARILISGAAGRIGGHLLETLRHRGCDAVGFDLRGENLPRADIRNRDDLGFIFGQNMPVDTVIHCAALAHRQDWSDPSALETVNVSGTVNMCDSAIRAGVRRFLFFSSMDVYSPEAFALGPVSEDAALEPAAAYAATKLKGEEYLLSKSRDFENLVILRFAPVYSSNLLGDIRKRVFLARGLGYRFRSNARRFSLCHIDNVAEATSLLIEAKLSPVEILNVGDARAVSQEEILGYLARNGVSAALFLPLPGFLGSLPSALRRGGALSAKAKVLNFAIKMFGETALNTSRMRSLGYRGARGILEHEHGLAS